MNRCRINNKNYFFLVIVFFVSIGYSVLNKNLVINGNSEVKSNTWDIHFENIRIIGKSVDTNLPPSLDNDNLSINFSVALDLPGDFYEFTVDVVNAGSIDAMIDSIIKIPDLTADQEKYFKYIVEYQNGEQIKSNQLIKSKKSLRIKVRFEYRNDLTEYDLPTQNENFNLGFELNFIQADNTSISVLDNGYKKIIEFVNVTEEIIGSELCLSTECFYVLNFTEDTVFLMPKYNLMVGNVYDGNNIYPLENPTGIQDALAAQYIETPTVENPVVGVINFSDTNYWFDIENREFNSDVIIEYDSNPDFEGIGYVYNEKSLLYPHVEFYKSYLEDMGIIIKNARLLSASELLGSASINSDGEYKIAPFWVGSVIIYAHDDYEDYIWGFGSDGIIFKKYSDSTFLGVRPIIEIAISEFAFYLEDLLE